MSAALCPEHQMSTNVCGCGVPALKPSTVREKVRDFTVEPEGKSLRTPFSGGVVEQCPSCDRLGAHLVLSERRGHRAEQWLHEAVVSYLGDECKGYTTHDACTLDGDALAALRRKRARQAGA